MAESTGGDGARFNEQAFFDESLKIHNEKFQAGNVPSQETPTVVNFKEKDQAQWQAIQAEVSSIGPSLETTEKIGAPKVETKIPELNTFVRNADDGTPITGYVKDSESKKNEDIWKPGFSAQRTTLNSASEVALQFKIDKKVPVGTYIEFAGKYYIVSLAQKTADAGRFGLDSVFVRVVPEAEVAKAVRRIDQQAANGLIIWTTESAKKALEGQTAAQPAANTVAENPNLENQPIRSKILKKVMDEMATKT